MNDARIRPAVSSETGGVFVAEWNGLASQLCCAEPGGTLLGLYEGWPLTPGFGVFKKPSRRALAIA